MEVHPAYRAYQSCTFTYYRTDFGINRCNNGRCSSGIQGFSHWPVCYTGHNWPAVRDAAHGRRALVIVVSNKTANQAGSHFGVSLGGCALAYSANLGTGGDLAVLRILMFVFKLAPVLVVAGDIGDIVRSCVPELPAFYCGNCYVIDYW